MSSVRSPLRRLAALFGWTRHSYYLLSAFLLVCGLIVYIWWPLAQEVLAYIDWRGPWWQTFDWLLVGIWLAMSLLIMAKADLRADVRLVLVGLVGGLVIESWGTQTNLWFYYTNERPPLWIIPAWPIAALATDRLTRLVNFAIQNLTKNARWQPNIRPSRGFRPAPNAAQPAFGTPGRPFGFFRVLYWLTFGGFAILLLAFVAPTFHKSLTILSVLLCAGLIFTPTDYRWATLTFLAGAGLGFFLEYWGTTRACWTYYTYQTPPFFAVLAHGMASVAFWRGKRILNQVVRNIRHFASLEA